MHLSPACSPSALARVRPFTARLALVGALAAALAWASPARAAPGPLDALVDVVEDTQPVRDVFARLEARHGLSYVAADAALERAGPVTVRLRQLPLHAAIDVICSAAGLAYELRGDVLVIRALPDDRPAPLPVIREGLVPPPARRNPPAAAREAEGEPVHAVGHLVAFDREARTVRLDVDGAERTFHLPADDPGDLQARARRLEAALAKLKPGARIALAWRLDGKRAVIADLVGGTVAGAAAPRGAPRRAPAQLPPEGAGEVAPVTSVTPGPAARGPEEGPPVPALTATRAPGATSAIPDGGFAGRLAGRDGELVRVTLVGGVELELALPPATDPGERRARIMAALDALATGERIMGTYEEREGRKVITNTITQSR